MTDSQTVLPTSSETTYAAVSELGSITRPYPFYDAVPLTASSALLAIATPPSTPTPDHRQSKLSKLDTQLYREFRDLLRQIGAAIASLHETVGDDGLVPETSENHIVEIETLLRVLYQCRWGEKDCLKKIVVSLEGSVLNAKWTRSHVDYIRAATRILKVRYNIDQKAVDDVQNLADEFGLDEFRGSFSEPSVVKKYRLVEE